MGMDETVLEERLSFRMLGLSFYSKLDWGSYTVSVAKAASKGIGTFIRSVRFLSPAGVILYVCVTQLCVGCCRAWGLGGVGVGVLLVAIWVC